MEGRRPVDGDFLTLFDIGAIARWTRHGESTIRRWIACGKIPDRFLTRPGGRIFMSGDQLARLIRSWQERQADASVVPEQGAYRRTSRVRRQDPFAAARRDGRARTEGVTGR